MLQLFVMLTSKSPNPSHWSWSASLGVCNTGVRQLSGATACVAYLHRRGARVSPSKRSVLEPLLDVETKRDSGHEALSRTMETLILQHELGGRYITRSLQLKLLRRKPAATSDDGIEDGARLEHDRLVVPDRVWSLSADLSRDTISRILRLPVGRPAFEHIGLGARELVVSEAHVRSLTGGESALVRDILEAQGGAV